MRQMTSRIAWIAGISFKQAIVSRDLFRNKLGDFHRDRSAICRWFYGKWYFFSSEIMTDGVYCFNAKFAHRLRHRLFSDLAAINRV